MLVDGSGAVKADVAEGDVTVVTSKNGGALTPFILTDKWTDLGQGLYTIDFASGDLDTEGFFAYLVTVTGCDQYSGIMYVSDWETNVDAILEDTATTLDGKINTIDTNVDSVLEDTATTLDGKITTVDTVVDAIKEKTDNLPTDPADESLLEAELLTVEINLRAAITDTEGNIRGGGDTLDIISDQIDPIIPAFNAIKGAGWTDENLTTIDTLIDAIKAKTDNLPVDPADESLLEAAITTAEGNIRGADSDTLETLSDQIDEAQAELDTLPDDPADESLIEAAITATEGNIRGADADTLETLSDQLDPVALEATLAAMKGVGWTTESLVAIQTAIDTDVLGDLTVLNDKLNAIKLIEDYLKQKESGRWKIENYQLTYYDADGTTVLKRFNLFNKDGHVTNENPYERVPV